MKVWRKAQSEVLFSYISQDERDKHSSLYMINTSYAGGRFGAREDKSGYNSWSIILMGEGQWSFLKDVANAKEKHTWKFK